MEFIHNFVSAHDVIISAGLLIIAYAFIATEKIPKVTIALLGAAITILLGLVSQTKALDGVLNPLYFAQYIDFNVIFLLVSMMIIVNITTRSGVFSYIANELLKMTKGHPVLILIALGKGAADIVFLCTACLHKLLEFRNNRIVGTASIGTDTEIVVDLFTAVERQDDVVHLLIHIFDLIVGQLDTVGGDGEQEMLVVQLLLLSRVSDRLLDDFPVHQRFTAKKVEVEVAAFARLFDQEVNRFFSSLQAHHRPVSAVIACTSKAVFTSELAVLRDQQAHCLDRRRDHPVGKLGVIILREQNPVGVHAVQLIISLGQLTLGELAGQLVQNLRRTFFCHWRRDIVQQPVRRIVHNRNAAAVDVQNDIKTVKAVFVNHEGNSFIRLAFFI